MNLTDFLLKALIVAGLVLVTGSALLLLNNVLKQNRENAIETKRRKNQIFVVDRAIKETKDAAADILEFFIGEMPNKMIETIQQMEEESLK